MYGLAEAVEPLEVIEVGGKEYKLAPLTVGDYAEIEKRIAAGQRPPLEVLGPYLASPDLSEVMKGELLKWAYRDDRRQFVPSEDVFEFLGTLSGEIYRWYLMLRHNHPEITLDEARLVMKGYGDSERRAEAQLRNDGLPKNQEAPEKAGAKRKRSNGRQSSARSSRQASNGEKSPA